MVYQKDPTGRLVRGIVNKSMGFHGVYFDVYIIYIYICMYHIGYVRYVAYTQYTFCIAPTSTSPSWVLDAWWESSSRLINTESFFGLIRYLQAKPSSPERTHIFFNNKYEERVYEDLYMAELSELIHLQQADIWLIC